MKYGMGKIYLLPVYLAWLWTIVESKSNLNVIRQWSALEFAYPSEEARAKAVENGYFVPLKSVPIDVDAYYGNGTQAPRIFVTIPRFDVGRPITLGTVDENGLISGYPNYTWHNYQGSNCEGLTSVFRVAIDKCHRLWVMDAGVIGDDQKCQPQLLAFDLKTDKLIYRYKVPSASFIPSSLFITPVVDVRDSCSNDVINTFVYVADVDRYGLLVVDVARNRSWRVTHRYFYPYPSHGSFNIEGESFDLMDGVLGMALSPYMKGADRILYFHALASTTENYVKTSLLRNDSFIQDPNANPTSIKVFRKKRPNQSAAEAMDKDGNLYFGLMDPPSMWSWNSSTTFSQKNFCEIEINRETLQFSSGVKIVNNPKGHQELWVLTSRFQKAMTGTYTAAEVNFRILVAEIPELLKNTKCSKTTKYAKPLDVCK